MKKSNFLVCLILFAFFARANNVSLTNVSVANNATNTGKVIEFDLSWENSWRVSTGPANYDGVWVFFKYKDNDGTWRHLNFNGNNTTMPVGVAYNMAGNSGNPGLGLFIYRAANGVGTATATGIEAGITTVPGTFEVRGFAIEMVYVPQGSFWLGDGSTTAAYRSTYFQNGSTGDPYQVTGLGSTVQFGTATGNLNDPALSQPFTGTLSDNFPNGYEAFWMMKYELSLGAYRDYINTLTYSQQASHFPSPNTPQSGTGTCLTCQGTQLRAFLKVKVNGNAGTNTPAVVGCSADNDGIYDEANDGEWNSMGYANWPDIAAYLDWACLRPMTEMEYEKACRGPLAAVANEFAWGNDQIATTPYAVANANENNENITNAAAGVGNASYQTTTSIGFPLTIFPGQLRGGIFANASSSRTSSGAGYYGAMELTGNMVEFVITTGNAAGRSFLGRHGDGTLTNDGYADENRWPGINGNSDNDIANTNYAGATGATFSAGIGDKGGSMGVIKDACYVARRFYNLGTSINRNSSYGIRGVRSIN